jgi:membrane-associated phospholipid phosphatase
MKSERPVIKTKSRLLLDFVAALYQRRRAVDFVGHRPTLQRFVAVIASLPLLVLAAPNPVADWNQLITSCIGKECQTPALASRNLATYHLAIASAIESTQGRSEEDQLLAGAAAAHAVGKTLFSGEASRFDSLVTDATIDSEKSKLQEIGRASASSALAIREGDSSTTTQNYSTSFQPGQWERTCSRPPELPHWQNVRPFFLKDAKSFLPPAPPALDSPEYAKALREVQTYGARNSIERTPEQTMLAKFWSDFSYTSTPPGHWNEVARFLSAEHTLSPLKSARLFAALNLAMADVSIVCWNAKYCYNLWRPVTAIHRADEDGNAATHANPEWRPLLKTPPHPEYVSGHAAFSGAAATVLNAFFPEGTRFSVTSETVPNVVRTYESFDACAREIAESRVHGGIHYRFSGENGLLLGQTTAALVLHSIGSQNISQLINPPYSIP